MVDNYKDIFQKKKIIKFKLLLYYFHDDPNKKLKTVADEAGTTKSEITKGIAALVEDGLLEKGDARTTHLTESGRRFAEEYHRKYQIAESSLRRQFDKETAKEYAEKIAMQFDFDEIIKIFSIGAFSSKISDNLSEYQFLDGKQFCSLIGEGGFAVPFTIDPVFNPTSPIHHAPNSPAIEEELASFWRTRSKELATEKKTGRKTSKNAEGQFESFLKEIMEQAKALFFKRYLVYKENKNVSMADEAFLHPAFCQISDNSGYIKLHRITIKKKGMSGNVLTCKAEFLKYFNGIEFVECPFIGDDVEIPLEHFKFTRYGDCMIGKQLLQFKAECDVKDMPVSVAELVVVFYPI